MHRGPVAEIDLSALRHNLGVIRKACGKSGIIAVVKADAYGHGSLKVAETLSSAGVGHFAVAYCEEAILLREAGITGQILVLFDPEDIKGYFDHDLVPVISDIDTAMVFSAEGKRRGKRLPVHMKIDTGMGRMGFLPENAADSAEKISSLEGIMLSGLLSHFSGADAADMDYALQQLRLFSSLRDEIRSRTGLDLMSHMSNSSAIFSIPGSCLDAVRPGISLYGYSSLGKEFGLRPVMKVRSKIISVRCLSSGSHVSYGRTFTAKRDCRIAVVPVGYADGFNRLFSNNAEVLIKGRRAPVVGRVCMDIFMVDITDLQDAACGDEVVLLGSQHGETVTAAELASRINTIPYEILTSLGSRARKEYVN